jgi:hypothetical protein
VEYPNNPRGLVIDGKGVVGMDEYRSSSPAQTLPEAVRDVISVILSPSDKISLDYFGNRRLGTVYRGYLISQFLDIRSGNVTPAGEGPGARMASILAKYRLTGPGSKDWVQVYEHMAGVVAAAVTIAVRMHLNSHDRESVREAALLHDATKREDVERHGALASSLKNTDRSLESSMREGGFSAEIIAAAMNTGRAERQFTSARARNESIHEKGVIAAITGLADTRSIGADFLSLDQTLQRYLERKRDPESQRFFTKDWLSYYRAVEDYLRTKASDLDLTLDSADIYQETVFPEVFGPSPSAAIRSRYVYKASNNA